MTINPRFLIVLLAIITVTNLSLPPVKADWFHDDAKSRIAASLLSQNMSALR